MFNPTEIKVCGTCTDLLSLEKTFEAVHRLALSYAPRLDNLCMERKFEVSVIFSDSGSFVSVAPLEPEEANGDPV